MQINGQAQFSALPQHLQSKKETMEKNKLDPIKHHMDQLRARLNEQKLAMNTANSIYQEKKNKFNDLSNTIIEQEEQSTIIESESKQLLEKINAFIDTMNPELPIPDASFRQIDELHLKNNAVLEKLKLLQLEKGIAYEQLIILKHQQNASELVYVDAKHQSEYIEIELEENAIQLEFEQTQINKKIQYKIEKQKIIDETLIENQRILNGSNLIIE